MENKFDVSHVLLNTKSGFLTEEKPRHMKYLNEFRTQQCVLFLEQQCQYHRPYTCFHWHFPNQKRRKPHMRSDGTFNYNPDVYCDKYDETTGSCISGDSCPYAHRNAGDTERRYHPRYFKTGNCIYETTENGACVKNGLHCAFAHGPDDVRSPVYDIRERQDPSSKFIINLPASLEKERVLSEDPKWNGIFHVLSRYKTELCKKPPRMCRQGYSCPFYHNGKDKRRAPDKWHYRSTPCPSVRPGDEWLDSSLCETGDSCSFCHTRTEQQFHPEIYKSSKCNDVGHSGYCPRGPFCAFAHCDPELIAGRDFLTRLRKDHLSFRGMDPAGLTNDIEGSRLLQTGFHIPPVLPQSTPSMYTQGSRLQLLSNAAGLQESTKHNISQMHPLLHNLIPSMVPTRMSPPAVIRGRRVARCSSPASQKQMVGFWTGSSNTIATSADRNHYSTLPPGLPTVSTAHFDVSYGLPQYSNTWIQTKSNATNRQRTNSSTSSDSGLFPTTMSGRDRAMGVGASIGTSTYPGRFGQVVVRPGAATNMKPTVPVAAVAPHFKPDSSGQRLLMGSSQPLYQRESSPVLQPKQQQQMIVNVNNSNLKPSFHGSVNVHQDDVWRQSSMIFHDNEQPTEQTHGNLSWHVYAANIDSGNHSEISINEFDSYCQSDMNPFVAVSTNRDSGLVPDFSNTTFSDQSDSGSYAAVQQPGDSTDCDQYMRELVNSFTRTNMFDTAHPEGQFPDLIQERPRSGEAPTGYLDVHPYYHPSNTHRPNIGVELHPDNTTLPYLADAVEQDEHEAPVNVDRDIVHINNNSSAFTPGVYSSPIGYCSKITKRNRCEVKDVTQAATASFPPQQFSPVVGTPVKPAHTTPPDWNGKPCYNGDRGAYLPHRNTGHAEQVSTGSCAAGNSFTDEPYVANSMHHDHTETNLNYKNIPQSPLILPSPFSNPGLELQRLTLQREMQEIKRKLDSKEDEISVLRKERDSVTEHLKDSLGVLRQLFSSFSISADDIVKPLYVDTGITFGFERMADIGESSGSNRMYRPTIAHTTESICHSGSVPLPNVSVDSPVANKSQFQLQQEALASLFHNPFVMALLNSELPVEGQNALSSTHLISDEPVDWSSNVPTSNHTERVHTASSSASSDE